MSKSTTITKAVEALTADTERRLAIRPTYWRGSGEGLVLHGGNLYRVAPGLDPSIEGPAYCLGAAEIACRWDVLPLVEVRVEPTIEAETPRPRARAKKPAGDRRERRGRPSAEELRAELPEGERDSWLGVAEAAKAAGIGKDKVRRAVAAGELAVRLVRGVSFVELRAVRELKKVVAPGPVTPAADTDVLADLLPVDGSVESFS